MNKKDYMCIGIYCFTSIIFKVPDNLTKEEIIKELNRISQPYFIIFDLYEDEEFKIENYLIHYTEE